MNIRMAEVCPRGAARAMVSIAVALCALSASAVGADGGVTFSDVTAAAGINFVREPTPSRLSVRQAIDASSPVPVAMAAGLQINSPQKEHGTPGVALFDYDRDGDLDIYVTNGPGAPNSLLQNQWKQTGQLTFVDVAAAAGVTATAGDGAGVCFGDTDNDGDLDFYVTNLLGPNNFFVNNGNGTFADRSVTSGLAVGTGYNPSGCSFADFDNDGRLDLVVANTYADWNNRRPVFVNAIDPGLQHNLLFMNRGGNRFQDVSAASGIQTIDGLPGGSYTWAIAAVDYDQDGDSDIVWADTQGPAPTNPSEERGFNRVFKNDGTGHFTDVTRSIGLGITGSWMGLAFGDLNCDGAMDFFSTNLGRYMGGATQNSTWFLGNGSGGFTNPGTAPLPVTPFGWGASIVDYDNDGDQDIAYFGDDDVVFFIAADNPGTLLRNQGCSATFLHDQAAGFPDQRARNIQGSASGDLNDDGFADFVTGAGLRFVPSAAFRLIALISGGPFGSTFDPISSFENVFTGRVTPGFLTYLNPTRLKGNLEIDLNSGGNGNGWVKVTALGAKGIIDNSHSRGRVNRAGIGAVLNFTPEGGPTTLKPVIGGSSHISQDELTVGFGLGTASAGLLEVMWPGGVRNRLYDVAAGERLTLPEIPCTYFADAWEKESDYRNCVKKSIKDLERAGIVTRTQGDRLIASAARAYEETGGDWKEGSGRD